MTPAELREARLALGLTQRGLAIALRMGKYGWQTVHRWETSNPDEELRGEVGFAVEALLLASITRDGEYQEVDDDFVAVPREVYDGLLSLAPEIEDD